MRPLQGVFFWLVLMASTFLLTSPRLAAQDDHTTDDVTVSADFDGDGTYEQVTFVDLGKSSQPSSGSYVQAGTSGYTWERSGQHVIVRNASGTALWTFRYLSSNSNAGAINSGASGSGVGNWKR